MNPDGDPFAHHPVLREKIIEPEQSFFRSFRPADLDDLMARRGLSGNWRRSDEEIEASRRQTLEGRQDKDLWVFGYGSLMWDPAFRFAEIRRGRLAGFSRRFCLRDTLGGRGTRDAPGLMAALDEGTGCHGLAFRIRGEDVAEETPYLWRREMLVPAYRPVFGRVETAHGEVEALAFAADRSATMIRPDLTLAEQIELIATGTGFLGTSLEYLENLAEHFAALGISDPDIEALCEAVDARRAAAVG